MRVLIDRENLPDKSLLEFYLGEKIPVIFFTRTNEFYIHSKLPSLYHYHPPLAGYFGLNTHLYLGGRHLFDVDFKYTNFGDCGYGVWGISPIENYEVQKNRLQNTIEYLTSLPEPEL
jgi:hypothetical protein